MQQQQQQQQQPPVTLQQALQQHAIPKEQTQSIRAALSSNRHALLQQTLLQPEQQIQVHSLPHHNLGAALKDEPILNHDAFLAPTNVSHLSASKHAQLAHHLTAPLSPPMTPPQQEQAKLLIQNQPKIHLTPQQSKVGPVTTIMTSSPQQQQPQLQRTQKIIVQTSPVLQQQTVTQQTQPQQQQTIINSTAPQPQQQKQLQQPQQQQRQATPVVTATGNSQQLQNMQALNQLTVEQLQVRSAL